MQIKYSSVVNLTVGIINIDQSLKDNRSQDLEFQGLNEISNTAQNIVQ